VETSGNSLSVRAPHFAPKAKRMVHFFLNGGPSHVDTFDPKPKLLEYAGKPLPMNYLTERRTGGALPSPFEFKKYGQSGLEISELFETLKATDEGTLDAEIIVASKPTDKEVDTLVKSLEKKFNKKIDAKVTIDEAIIGGIKVIVGDTVIDASVREQLQNLAYALKS
jgi:hypothetical protein